MIYVDARGRIGNQLFQYCVARNLQCQINQPMVISSYNLKKKHKDWPYLLDQFVLNENVIHTEEKLPFFANIDGYLLKAVRHFFPGILFALGSKMGIYIWVGQDYKNIEVKEHKNYYFVGFWQSEKYFFNIRELIRAELVPKTIDYSKNMELLKLIENTESVCVSIRRGDYVIDKKIRKMFYVCSEEYFKQALYEVKKNIPNATLFLFSDDVKWARETIKFEGNIYSEVGDDTPMEKLRLMSACKHFVLSNSSFSWWAQYLSSYENKQVYAPSRWMPSHKSSKDCAIYLSEWTLIEV